MPWKLCLILEQSEQESVADSKSQTGTIRSNDKFSTRGRRIRFGRSLEKAEETSQGSRRQSLRRRNTRFKPIDFESIEEEDEEDSDFDSRLAEEDDGDDKKFRRLKKVKKNLTKSEASESKNGDEMTKEKEEDSEAQNKMEEEPVFE